MPLLKRRRVFAAKTEGTIGTAESLTGAEGVYNAYNVMIQPKISMTPRESQGGFGMLTSVPQGLGGVATFRTGLGWDGTATEPNWADVLLPACGWVKTGQTFFPITAAPGSAVKTLTIGAYCDDGAGQSVLKILAGCMGNFTIVLPTGQMAYIDWEFQGVWQDVTDQSIIAPTYPTVKDLRFASGLVEWNNVNMCVSNVTIESGNTIILRECPTTDGYLAALITNRVPKIKCNPEAVKTSTQDRWSTWTDQTEQALEIDIAGPTTSYISFDADKAQIINNQEGDRNGMVTDEIEFQCNKNGTNLDQELKITFTAAV